MTSSAMHRVRLGVVLALCGAIAACTGGERKLAKGEVVVVVEDLRSPNAPALGGQFEASYRLSESNGGGVQVSGSMQRSATFRGSFRIPLRRDLDSPVLRETMVGGKLTLPLVELRLTLPEVSGPLVLPLNFERAELAASERGRSVADTAFRFVVSLTTNHGVVTRLQAVTAERLSALETRPDYRALPSDDGVIAESVVE